MSSAMLDSGYIDVPSGTKTVHLQEIIDTADPGSTIRLGEGDFVITQSLVINRSDIKIEGAGDDATRLIQSSVMVGDPVIKVGPQWVAGTLEELPTLEFTATKGARMLRFEDGHGLKAGDVIYITQENTPELFAEIGDTEWQQDAPLRTFMVEVERVGGNSVALTERLPFDFAPSITTVHKMDPLTGVSLSGFEVANTYGASDPGDFSNTLPDEYRNAAIDISNTLGIRLDDITITQPASNGINIEASLAPDFTDITVEGAHNKGAGGNGYGIQIRDVYFGEFTEIEVYDVRHAVLFSSYQTAIGNHVAVEETNRDINFHGGLDHDNTVVVDTSHRDGTEQFYLASTVMFNEGESWGAPTNPDENMVVFHYANGTTRVDHIHAHDGGAWISGFQGADHLHGGDGDDFIFGETGHDVLYASGGNDSIDGGSGVDTLVLEGELADYHITQANDGFVIRDDNGTTEVEDVESFEFDDVTLSQNQLDSLF